MKQTILPLVLALSMFAPTLRVNASPSAVEAIQTANATSVIAYNNFAPSDTNGKLSETVGWTFTVGSGFNLSVSALGVFDKQGLGLNTSHAVGIWNSSGTLLGSTTVNATITVSSIPINLSGSIPTVSGGIPTVSANNISYYRYASLTAPISLSAGGTYTIGAFYTGASTDSLIYNSSQTIDSKITFGTAVQSASGLSGLAQPASNQSYNQGFFGPNFQFSSTAVPATYWKGQTNTNWSGANWASAANGTTTTATPTSADGIYFSATGAANKATTLDANFAIKSLTVEDTISISGSSKTLTIGGTSIVDAGGSLTINSGVTFNNGNSDIYAGSEGAGTLNISGGTVSSRAGYVGCTALGTANVSSGSWTMSGALTVGKADTGVLNVSGGKVSSQNVYIGDNTGSQGTVTVSGGTLTHTDTNGGPFYVGNGGTGVLNLLSSGVVYVGGVYGTGTLTLGKNSGSSGTLNIGTFGGATTAGTLNAIEVNGGSGTAVVNFNQTDTTYFAPTITGTTSVNQLGSGTTILSADNYYTGKTTVSAGALYINGNSKNPDNQNATTSDITVNGGILGGNGTVGGNITVNSGGTISAGADAMSIGTLSGKPGSTILTLNQGSTARFKISGTGDGAYDQISVLTAQAMGKVTLDLELTGDYKGAIGDTFQVFVRVFGSLSPDNFTVTGNLDSKYKWDLSQLAVAGAVKIALGALPATYWKGQTNGTWSGANWASDSGGTVTTATPTDSDNVTFSAAGSQNQTATILDVDTTINNLTVNSDTGISGSKTLTVGSNTRVNSGTLTLSGGITATSGNSYVQGTGTGATVTVTGADTHWDTNSILKVSIDNTQTGTLNVLNGGNATSSTLSIGEKAGSVGTVTVNGTGSKLTSTLDIIIGGGGNGTLNIQSGGELVTNRNAFIAASRGSVGIATVTGNGSKWTISENILFDGGGDGTLNILNGGTVSNKNALLASNIDLKATVTVDGAGSTWTNTGRVTVGDVGPGTLNIQNSGLVTVGNGIGTLTLGAKTGSSGTLNIGSATTPSTSGALTAAEVHGGSGAAFLNFNQTDDITFAPKITGSTKVSQLGTGSTTLTTANTYTGGTTVNAGLLITQNSFALGTGQVKVNGGSLRAIGELNVSDLVWKDGYLVLSPLLGDVIHVKSSFTNGGNGGTFFIGPQDLEADKAYTLVDFDSTDFTLGQFKALSTNSTVQYKSSFILNEDNVQIIIKSAKAQGDLLHNIDNGVPTFADFTTASKVVSGLTEKGFQEIQTIIKSFTSTPGAALTVPSVNTLTVTNDVNIDGTTVTVDGQVKVGGNFTDPNSTTIVNNLLTVGGTTTIAGNSILYVASSGVFTTGLDLNVTDSALGVDGLAIVGGSTNLYSGSTTIVNGTLQTPAVNVFRGAYLGGSGTIVGNVNNSGTVSPGYGIGTLHLKGNYRQSNSGSLLIQIASPNAHDQLVVSGRANLGGTLRIQAVGGLRAPKRGDAPYKILSSRGGVSGTFSNVITPYAQGPGSLVYLGAEYTSNAVFLAALQNTFANALSFVKLTPNQTAAAAALDSALSDVRQDKVLTYLDAQNITKVPHQLDKIAPEELTSLYTLGFSQSDSYALSLDQRFADIRSGGPDTPTLAGPAPSAKNSKVVSPVQEAPEDHYGFFITETGNSTSLNGSYNANGYDIETGGTAIGIDVRLTKNFVVGFTAGYARTDSDLVGGGDVKVDGGRIGLYGLYHADNGLFAQALVTEGYNSYDTKRAALDGTAKGSTHGNQFDAAVTLGYDAKLGSFTVTPLASLLYTNIGLSSYDESGSLEPLHIGDQTETSLHSRFGLRAAYTAKVGAVTLTPSVTAQWQHEFNNDELGLTSRFANGAGDEFTVHGPRTGNDSALVSAALNVSWSRYAAYAAYQTDLGRSNVTNQTVLLGFRVDF